MTARRSIILAAAGLVSATGVRATPLHDYTAATVHVLDNICTEASGVAYDRDTGSLFVIGDEGGNFIELSRTGQVKSSILLHNFNSSADPEGVARLGGGRFMVALERMRRAYPVNYVAGTELTRINNTGAIFSGDGSVGNNSGLEGICYDPLTDSIWGIQEQGPVAVYQMTGYDSAQPVVTSPFKGSKFSNAAITSLSDLYLLANSNSFAAADPRRQNVLFLCRDDKKIVEMTRTGSVVDTLDLTFLNRTTIEGITMDDEGVLYLVSEEIPAASEGKNSRLIVLRPPGIRMASQSIVRSGNQMTASLTWDSVAGERYVIEYSPDLATAWSPAGSVQVATGSSTSATSNPVNGERGFFRVRKTAP